MNMNPTPPAGTNRVDDEIDLVGVLDVLVSSRWFIARICLVCIAAATLFAFLAVRKYEASIMIQVEDSGLSGTAPSLPGGVSSLFDVKSTAAAEEQIVASRLVVSSVVDELHSYIDVKPKRFPLIGDFVSRFNDGILNPGVLGFGGFVWGTESADVTRFDVPKRIEGDHFTLKVLPHNRYQLSGWDLDQPVTGEIGRTETFSTQYGPLVLNVKGFNAIPGTSFALVRNSRFDTINAMQTDLDVKEKVKQSGVLVGTLRGPDPKRVSEQLEAVARYYVRQNVDRKVAEAAQSLDFLNGQLPMLKERLEEAEQRYTKMRNTQGTVDLTEESKLVLQQTADSKTRLLELQQKRDDLATRYMPSHPEMVAIDAQIATLRTRQGDFDKEVKRLPDLQQDAVRLMLDVKVNTDLYTALLGNIQQLELIKAGKTGNVRLIDSAVVPELQVFPNRPLVIGGGALVGLLLGVALAFARDFLFGGIAGPGEIERHVGLRVYATIPSSRYQQQMDRKSEFASGSGLLSTLRPDEPAIESLRSLRTALQFELLNARNKIVLFTGPTPGVGKSFVSANLGALLAAGGKRVLLVDGDLRRGYLHQYFGLLRERGLADVITDEVTLDQAIHRDVLDNLDFLPTGALPSDATGLLMDERVRPVFERLESLYDVVLIDSSPVLAVSDATVLARCAATTMLVARADKTRTGELVESIQRLAHGGAQAAGILLNGLNLNSGRQAYGSKHGGYRYVAYSYGSIVSPGKRGFRSALASVLSGRRT